MKNAWGSVSMFTQPKISMFTWDLNLALVTPSLAGMRHTYNPICLLVSHCSLVFGGIQQDQVKLAFMHYLWKAWAVHCCFATARNADIGSFGEVSFCESLEFLYLLVLLVCYVWLWLWDLLYKPLYENIIQLWVTYLWFFKVRRWS